MDYVVNKMLLINPITLFCFEINLNWKGGKQYLENFIKFGNEKQQLTT